MIDKSKNKLNFIDIGLLAVAISWGASYALMKIVVEAGISVSELLMFRFGLAAPILLYISRKSVKNINKSELWLGIYFGLLLYCILFFETMGVKYTTPSNAGFLITLSVIFVPIYESLFGKNTVSKKIYYVVSFSIVGSLFLLMEDIINISINKGDAFILLAAIIRGFQIFQFSDRTKSNSHNIVNISLIQMIFVTILSFSINLFNDSISLDKMANYSSVIWISILVLAIFATAFAFLMQIFAAKATSSIRVALILSTEPVFAVIFSILLFSNSISIFQFIGGSIIIFSSIYGKMIEEKVVSTKKISKKKYAEKAESL